MSALRTWRFHEADDSPRGIPQACCHCGRNTPDTNPRYFLMRTEKEKDEIPPAQIHTGCLRRVWKYQSTVMHHIEYSATGKRIVIIGSARSPILYLPNGRHVEETA